MVVKKAKPAAKKPAAKKAVKAKKVAKPAAKKVAKPVVKKAVAKVEVKKKPPRQTGPAKAAFTKSQLLLDISEQAEISKKHVVAVFDELAHIVKRHVMKGAVGHFTLPGLCKILTLHKPATPARKGVNPFTGEETMFKAKPARTVIKVRALKGLKDMV